MFKRKFISLIMVTIAIVAFGPGMQSTWATSPCFALVRIPSISIMCTCSDGDCPPMAISTRGYYTCIWASSGYQTCDTQLQPIGTAFPCDKQYNWTAILLCAALNVACAVICVEAMLAPQLIPACLACIASYGLSCQGCALITCNQATTGTEVYGYGAVHYEGECP